MHGALHECGLEQYYEMRDRERARGEGGDEGGDEPALVTGRGFEHLDDARFLASHTMQDGGVDGTGMDGTGMRRVELRI